MMHSIDKPSEARREKMDVMAFLNEVKTNYPNAISMASGRPDTRYFKIEESLEELLQLFRECSDENELQKLKVLAGQYNKAKGIIEEELVQYYQKDYEWTLRPQSILLTVGAQEAMALSIQAVCQRGKEAVAFMDPCYIGFSSCAELSGYDCCAIAMDDDYSISLAALEQSLAIQQRKAIPIKLLYLTPDFNNPTGAVLSLEKRKQLLSLADQYDFYILEDNAYSIFRYDGKRLPFIKEMDRSQRVIYVESFSKTLFPAIRLAAVIFDPMAKDALGRSYLDQMIQLKGYITVNTSSINQLLLSGILRKYSFSLKAYNQEKVEALRLKRDLMAKLLNQYAQQYHIPIKYQLPEGGFFILVELPFQIEAEDVNQAAKDFGIVFCLQSFFSFSANPGRAIRLSFSELELPQIEEGIARLFEFIKTKI